MNSCLCSSRVNLSGILMFIILGTDVSWILYCIIVFENEFLYNFFFLTLLFIMYLFSKEFQEIRENNVFLLNWIKERENIKLVQGIEIKTHV